MLKKLQELGLSENEAKVYLASLEIGKATADELSKHAQIKRPTTYVQIESLTKKGLMSTYEEGKKTYFVPESPEYLKRLHERKKQEMTQEEKELETLLPTLKDLFDHAGERPKVRFFSGKEGLITMREEVLKAKNKEVHTFFSLDALASVFTKEERDIFSKKRSEKNIKLKAIYSRRDGKLEEITNPFSEMRYISPERFPLKSDILIYDENVAFMTLEGEIFGTIITGHTVAQTMRSIFKLIWEILEP